MKDDDGPFQPMGWIVGLLMRSVLRTSDQESDYA